MSPSQRAAWVDVVIEELAERTGLWCDVCLLPSRWEWDFAALLNGKLWYTFSFAYCPDCDTETKVGIPE
jgi:hypothetical protein